MEDINQLKEPVTEKGDLSSPPLGEAGRGSRWPWLSPSPSSSSLISR